MNCTENIVKKLRESRISEADEAKNQAYEEFKKNCTSNRTWQEANKICEKYGYRLHPTSCVEVLSSGKKIPRVGIVVDRSKRYNPDIYYGAESFSNDTPSFKIQTISYGSLSLEEHTEFIESVTNAHNMIEELSKIDFLTLYEDNSDY